MQRHNIINGTIASSCHRYYVFCRCSCCYMYNICFGCGRMYSSKIMNTPYICIVCAEGRWCIVHRAFGRQRRWWMIKNMSRSGCERRPMSYAVRLAGNLCEHITLVWRMHSVAVRTRARPDTRAHIHYSKMLAGNNLISGKKENIDEIVGLKLVVTDNNKKIDRCMCLLMRSAMNFSCP